MRHDAAKKDLPNHAFVRQLRRGKSYQTDSTLLLQGRKEDYLVLKTVRQRRAD
jgi:hypothetical protein